jgi:hypothetical protein
VTAVAKKKRLTAKDKDTISRILSEVGLTRMEESLTDDDMRYMLKVADELSTEGRSAHLNALFTVDYRETPVDIETFIDDDAYMGIAGRSLYPKWREVLLEVFEDGRHVREVIFTGSIGTGKSTCGSWAYLYKLYQLSCLRDPQSFYEMAPGSPIVFGLYSVHKYKAEGTLWATIAGLVESSQYFTATWPRDPKLTSTFRFPNNVKVNMGASSLHALGENVFSCAIDEMDFMRGAKDNDPLDRGQAHALHTNLTARMKSRFLRFGHMPGIQLLISSKTTDDGYVENRIEETKGDPEVYVADFPLWGVKPDRFSDRKFFVFVGTKHEDPRVLNDDEVEETGKIGRVIAVPEDFRKDFEDDVVLALRDLAGEAISASNPLIPSRNKMMSCVDPTRKHPFKKEEFSITLNDDSVIEDYLNHSNLVRVYKSRYVPRVNSQAPRFVHIDLSITGDAVGFAMGHVSGYKQVTRRRKEDGFAAVTAKAPIIYMDLTLRIVPKVGDRIDFQKIRDFVYSLRTYGFPIVLVTMDSFQSEDSVQQFKKNKFESELFSMDRSTLKEGHPYTYLRQAVMEERLDIYYYEMFLLEATNLVMAFNKSPSGIVKTIVDHPAYMRGGDGRQIKGSKDVADAVGAVVRHCMVMASGSMPELVQSSPKDKKKRSSRDRAHFTKSDSWVVDDYDDLDNIMGIQP